MHDDDTLTLFLCLCRYLKSFFVLSGILVDWIGIGSGVDGMASPR